MKDIMDSLVWINLFSVVMWVVLFMLLIPVIKAKIQASREAKKEENKIQHIILTSELFKEAPELYIKLEELQRNYRMISMGLKWGWLPFIIIFIALIGAIGNINLERSPLPSVMILAIVILPLLVFYAFLFKQSFKLNAKITATKLEIATETRASKGSHSDMPNENS